jgi:pimeloyl-ACP methyl ester carboxylesterase
MGPRLAEVATVACMSGRMQEVVVSDKVALSVYRWDGERDDSVPFLLVHGLASNLHLWDGVAEALAGKGLPVAAVDLRGHGRSAKPDAGYDFITMTDDLVAVLDALGFARAVVAGQSMGANLVLELAWRFLERVRGVACIDGGWIELGRRFPDWESCAAALAPPAFGGRPAAEIEVMLRQRHPDWPEAGIRGSLACFEHRPDGTVAPWLTAERHMALLRALWEHRPSTRYPEIEVPVLLVPAGHTSPAGERPEQVEAAAAALPRGEVHWMTGDHDLHAQHPEAVADLLSSFSPFFVDSTVPRTPHATKNREG